MKQPPKSVQALIFQRIQAGPPGRVWTANRFVDIGTRNSVDVALHRLNSENKIRRIDRGLYDIPRVNGFTKKAEQAFYKEVISAVAERDGARMLVDGCMAANDLGFSNAVPSSATVFTDARINPIDIGGMAIVFKTVAPSRLLWAGRPAANVVQALVWLRDVFPADEKRIASRLLTILADDEHGEAIREDLANNLADLPSWLVSFVKRVLAECVVDETSAPRPR